MTMAVVTDDHDSCIAETSCPGGIQEKGEEWEVELIVFVVVFGG